MSFIVSEIDMGDGADQSSQLGEAVPANTIKQVQESIPPEKTDTQSQPGAVDIARQTEVADTSKQQLTDEEVEKLDLGQTENIRQFRSTYEKNKQLRLDAETARDTLEQELKEARSKQGQGVYLSTDVPFEDFNPVESLQKMATEEPEYHDAVVDAVLEAHLWPNIATTIASIEGKELGRVENGQLLFDNDDQRQQYQQVEQVWDILARRTAGVDGKTLSGLIRIVADSPEIGAMIEAKLNGGYAPAMPQSGAGSGYQPPQFRAGGQQQVGVQTIQQIAAASGFDLSDPDQVKHATAIQSTQRIAAQVQAQAQSDRRSLEGQISQLKTQLEQVQGGQKQAATTTAQEAEQKAESRVAEHLKTAIETEFTEKYAAAIPKDRSGLANILKTQTRDQLSENPTFKEASATAKKWLKQAATAQDPAQRQRYEDRGLGAMAVIATLRTNTMAEVAQELLGKLPGQAAAAKRKADDNRGRKELPPGHVAPPPTTKVAPAASGDIEATRANIRRRMTEAGIRMS